MPRPDKFYLIELVEDPRGYRTETVTIIDNSSQPGHRSRRPGSRLTEQLRFTLAVRQARRRTVVGGRFGIKESTGGVGGDLYLFDDRLLLSVDVFDAKANQYPRIKATVSYAIWQRNLFVVAGADDMANYVRARPAAAARSTTSLAAARVQRRGPESLLLFGGGAAAGAASK